MRLTGIMTIGAAVALAAAVAVEFADDGLPDPPEQPIVLHQIDIAGDAHTGHRRRPQAIIRDAAGNPTAMIVSLREQRDDGVTISTAIAYTDDAGETWRDGGTILDRIQGTWQGDRAFGTAIVRDGDSWAMMSCGNDETGATPGIRSVGLWRSDDLVSWTTSDRNPIITVDDLYLDADMPSPVVGVYVRHIHRIGGTWYAMATIRGDHARWARTAVLASSGGLEGPWKSVGMAVDEATASPWWKTNDNLILSEPIQIGGRWYAVTRNGVNASDRDTNRFGIAVSDDYLSWIETGWMSDPMIRPNGSPITAAQTVILGPGHFLVSQEHVRQER